MKSIKPKGTIVCNNGIDNLNQFRPWKHLHTFGSHVWIIHFENTLELIFHKLWLWLSRGRAWDKLVSWELTKTKKNSTHSCSKYYLSKIYYEVFFQVHTIYIGLWNIFFCVISSKENQKLPMTFLLFYVLLLRTLSAENKGA